MDEYHSFPAPFFKSRVQPRPQGPLVFQYGGEQEYPGNEVDAGY